MSAGRRALLDGLADRIVGISPRRLRVAVDGRTAAGKTSFAHELAAAIRRNGRPTLRASFDDFKKPFRDAAERGYDRLTGEGYYRNAPDFETAQRMLLEPAGPSGSGTVCLCGHDPITGVDHRHVTVEAPLDAVLIVDSVFAMRPEYNEYWDFRIWLDVSTELSLARGVERDSDSGDRRTEVERVHRDRYQESERIYIAEIDPTSKADVIIDNTDFANPRAGPPDREPS
ncbi:MAG: hypothetical protein DHS20C19_02180 [Acidimicrobiales bacterium]|nr:MAG: hypothetical protein DHS20C19_02180 [Acidimicrobiales bacterium]